MARELSELVSHIYTGVGRPDGWPRTLEAIVGATDAMSGCIVAIGPDSPHGSVGCFHNIDPDWIREYNDYYHRFDPTPDLLADRSGVPVSDHVGRARRRETGGRAEIFYQEVMVPQDFRHTLAVGFSTNAAWKAALVLQRGHGQGPFEPGASERLGELGRHLRQALELHGRLQGADVFGGETLQQALHDAPAGVVVLDERARPTLVNARTREILAATDALAIGANTVSAATPEQQRRIDRLIADAIGAGKGTGQVNARRHITLHDRDDRAALRLTVSPLNHHHDGDPFGALNGAALLWLAPVGGSAEHCARELARIHGLTGAEADLLAWMLRGYSIDGVAEKRSVSRQTVRSQLKTVMGKTGVHRQAELIRLAMVTGAG